MEDYPLRVRNNVNEKHFGVVYKDKNGQTVRHGPSISYGVDNEVISICNYENGKKNGPALVFSRDGRLVERATYKNNAYDGLRERWYSNGQLWERSNYKDNKLEGLYEEWREDGVQIRCCKYVRDELIKEPVLKPDPTSEYFMMRNIAAKVIDPKQEPSLQELIDNPELWQKWLKDHNFPEGHPAYGLIKAPAEVLTIRKHVDGTFDVVGAYGTAPGLVERHLMETVRILLAIANKKSDAVSTTSNCAGSSPAGGAAAQ
jgi:hypothetical protein